VLARIGSTPIHNQTGLQGDVVLGGILLVLPISGQLVVAVDRDVPHAADESSLKKYNNNIKVGFQINSC
jgi:hypothetical protein